jgi:hypothetical protein
MTVRRKPAVSKTTATEKPAVSDAQPGAINGATPLDYMLGVMRDPAVEPARRDEMAKLALPYMHPKVTATEPNGQDSLLPQATTFSETDIARRIAFTLARAAQAVSKTH